MPNPAMLGQADLMRRAQMQDPEALETLKQMGIQVPSARPGFPGPTSNVEAGMAPGGQLPQLPPGQNYMGPAGGGQVPPGMPQGLPAGHPQGPPPEPGMIQMLLQKLRGGG